MEKKMNNKGFSLVELIIVIAIMVILVAVLAPQYLRYVEKSRVSSDTQTTVELINVMQVLAADPDVSLDVDTAGTKYTATGATDGKVTLSPDLMDKLEENGMMDEDAMKNIKYQSSAYKTAGVKIALKYDNSAKIWTIDTAGVDSSGSLKTGSNPPAGS